MEVEAQPLQALRNRSSMKWAAFDEDVLPLFVAESDFPLADPIRAVLQEAIANSDTGYSPPSSELPEVFSAFAREHWSWQVDPAQVWTTTDVGMAIVETLRRVTKPGEGVIINPPVYFPFFDLVEESGAKVIEVPLAGGIDTGWSLDLGAIENALAQGAKAYLLCNPHNPVGRVHSREELAAIAGLAKKYGASIISDEIHGPLTYPGETFVPFLAVSDEAREVGICLTAASKAFNLAGLKCAIMVTAGGKNQEIVGSLPLEVFWRTSLFGLKASIAGFKHSGEWLEGVVSSLDQNRKLLAELLSSHLPEVKYRMPQATYLAWLDFNALGWGEDPAAHILEHAKVALSNGPPFGVQGKGFARLNLACNPAVLREAISRIAAIR